MNPVWMISCILFAWALLQKTRTHHHTSNHSLESIRTGIITGLALSLFDIQLAYNKIVTKTKRLVSLDTVSSFVNQHTVYTLFVIFLSHISILISHTQLSDPVREHTKIPIWSHMIGAAIGLFTGYCFTIHHHRSILNGE